MDVNNDLFSPNLRGLIHVLADVLVREIEREMDETAKEPEKGTKKHDDKN